MIQRNVTHVQSFSKDQEMLAYALRSSITMAVFADFDQSSGAFDRTQADIPS